MTRRSLVGSAFPGRAWERRCILRRVSVGEVARCGGERFQAGAGGGQRGFGVHAGSEGLAAESNDRIVDELTELPGDRWAVKVFGLEFQADAEAGRVGRRCPVGRGSSA